MQIDLSRLFARTEMRVFGFKTVGMLPYGTGVICPNCGVKLRVVQTRALFVPALAFLSMGPLAWLLSMFDHPILRSTVFRSGIVVVWGTVSIATILLRRHLIYLKLAGDDVGLVFPESLQ
jgi:hypothetical protein